jgi:hypothetical protein
MKRITLFFVVLMFTLQAQAVDVVITLTPTQATRAAAACGTIMGYVDAQGAPRPCTMAEAKTWLISKLRDLVLIIERNAVAPAAFDPT